MAPKGKGAAAPEEAVDPNERVTPPAFSEESLAALSFDAAEPYTDPDPQVLPSSLESVVTSWQRPSEYLQALVEEGGEPYVVLPPVVAEDEGAEGAAVVSRELPNLLESVPHITDGEGAAVAEARRALQWMISCIQLVALHPGHVDEGCFLWELIHPQTEGRPRHVPSGKYAVKLFDQGAWRLVTVDDRVPFDAAGVAMLPRSTATLELWPLLLAKAIYKLHAGAPSSLSQDPTVLLRLTGWLPQRLPISPRLPLDAAWATLRARLGSEACVLALMLDADADADADADRDEGLAEVGLHRGPLVAVRDVREVAGEHYVRIESELMQWQGELRDTDEHSWSAELGEALEWKRWQRLRVRAAGLPLHDSWLRQPSLNAHFRAVLLLHRPLAERAVHEGMTDEAGAAAPALVVVDGSPDDPPAEMLLQLQAAPAMREPGGGGVRLALQPWHAWTAGSEPQTLLELRSDGAGCVPLMLQRGTPYCLALSGVAQEVPPPPPPEVEAAEEGAEAAEAAEAATEGEAVDGEAAAEAAAAEAAEAAEAVEAVEAPPPPIEMVTPACRFAVALSCKAALKVGSVAEIARSSLGLTVSELEGSLPELPQGEWRLSLGVALKPSQPCTLNATLSLAEAAVAACARLHVRDEDTCVETPLLGLSTGPLALAPNSKGHSLLLDCRGSAPLPVCAWALQVSSDAEVEVAEVALKPPQHLGEAYEPNVEYRAFRVVLAAEGEACAAAVHVATDEPRAEVALRVLQVVPVEGELRPLETEVKAASGLGCVSLLGVALVPSAAPAPGGKPAKGAAPPPTDTGPMTVLECRVTRRSAEALGLPTKAPPEAAAPGAGAEAEAEGAAEGEAAEGAAAAAPPGFEWKLSVASAGAVVLKKDSALETGLAAMRDGWEAAQPGRAAKAKAARESHLASLAPAEAADAVEGAEGAEGAPVPEAAAAPPAPERVEVRRGAEPVVVSAEERAAAAAERQAALAALAEERAAAELKREESRVLREASLNEQREKAGAARAAQRDAYTTLNGEREAIMAAHMPDKAPAEPVDDKGKKGKGDPKKKK